MHLMEGNRILFYAALQQQTLGIYVPRFLCVLRERGYWGQYHILHTWPTENAAIHFIAWKRKKGK